MKREKFLKFFCNKKLRTLILVSVCLLTFNLNVKKFKNSNFAKAQILSFKDENGSVKNLNEDEFKLNGFDLKVLKKGDFYKLHYTHFKTNAQFVFDLNNGYEQFSSIFFGCPPTDNKGKGHALEHLLASVIIKKLLKKYNSVGPKHFNGNANEYGFWFLINNSVFDFDLLENILKELKDPKFLRDKEKTFKREVHNKNKNDVKMGRMFHEMLNNETVTDFKKMDFRNLDDVRFYNYGGKSEEILKISFKEMEEFFKTYIHPSNMLVSFSCLNDSKQIKDVLEFFEKNYLNKFSKKTVNLNYSLKNGESFYKSIPWDERSDIFKGIDSKSYNYCARVCLDCENFNLNEKNALNIKAGIFVSFLKEEVNRLGYESVELDSDEILKGRVVLKFYGNDKTKFYENVLKENSKSILKSLTDFLEKALEYPPNRDVILNLDKVLAEEYYQSMPFNTPKRYRRLYKMYDTCFLSFVKHKTPFSDKIFKIQNNEILDDFQTEKQNFEENFLGSLKKLIDSNFVFIDFFEKTKMPYSVVNNSDGRKIMFKINKFKNADVFRFTEYVLFKNILNNKIESYGLSYKNLKNSNYVGDYPSLKENFSSFEAVNKFLSKNFEKLIKDFDFSELFFELELKYYAQKIKADIFKAEQILNILKSNKRFIEQNKHRSDIVFGRQKIVEDLRKIFKEFEILFDKKEDYENYKNNKNKFKQKYKNYFDNDNLNKDKDYSLFFKEFEEFVDYETKLFESVLENLNVKIKNIKNLKYSDVKESIESVKYIKS